MLAILLTISLPREDLKAWLLDVESDGERIFALGDEWAPPSFGVWNVKTKGGILFWLETACRARPLAKGGDGTIETASAVISKWAHAGPATGHSRLVEEGSGTLDVAGAGSSGATRSGRRRPRSSRSYSP